jgi:hypothetical protein
MKTVANRKPARKPSRSCRLYDGSPALLTLTVGPTQTDYWVDPILSDFGRGFVLTKCPDFGKDGASYAVNLDGARSTCECPGFLRWGHHGPCKHLSALLALQAAGKLPSPRPAPVDAIDLDALADGEAARTDPWDDI